jgi:replicative DNA helicase
MGGTDAGRETIVIDEQKIFEDHAKEKKTSDTADGSHVSHISLKVWSYWEALRDKTIRLILALSLFGSKIPYYMLGKLIIIGGYTSAGKSTLLSQMVADLCERTDAEVDIISLEDSREEKYMSLVSVVSDVGKKRLVTGDIFGDKNFYRDKVIDASAKVQGWPVNIYDDKYTLHAIESVISKTKAEIIFIDYIQNISAEGRSLYERMSKVATELFRICKQYNKCLVVLSQVSNESVREDSDVIGLKGAGELSAAADIVIMLKKGRGEDNKRVVKITVTKNRLFGETGDIDCQYSEHWTRVEVEKNGIYGLD